MSDRANYNNITEARTIQNECLARWQYKKKKILTWNLDRSGRDFNYLEWNVKKWLHHTQINMLN